MSTITIAPATVADLAIGDLVKLQGGNWSHGHPNADKVVTISTSVEESGYNGPRRSFIIPEETGQATQGYVNDGEWPFVFVSRPGVDLVVGGEEPTPIADSVASDTVTISRAEYERLQVEATREFSDYDERLRPMFYKVARVADAAGYCSEYDRIAGAVGAPDRDEMLNATYYVEVPVTVTFTIHQTVEVEARSEESAQQVVYDQYSTDEIVREAWDSDSIDLDTIINGSSVDWYNRSTWSAERIEG